MNAIRKSLPLVLSLALFSSAGFAGDALTNLKEIDQENEGTIDLEDRDGDEHTALEAPKTAVEDRITVMRVSDLHKLAGTFTEGKRLAGLKCLSMNFCWTGPREMTSKETALLSELKSLEQIDFDDVTVTPKQLLQLEALPKLRAVSFGRINSRVKFTDEHLAVLAEIESLQSVTLKHFPISEKAEAEFRQARPDCKLTVQRPKTRKKAG